MGSLSVLSSADWGGLGTPKVCASRWRSVCIRQLSAFREVRIKNSFSVVLSVFLPRPCLPPPALLCLFPEGIITYVYRLNEAWVSVGWLVLQFYNLSCVVEGCVRILRPAGLYRMYMSTCVPCANIVCLLTKVPKDCELSLRHSAGWASQLLLKSRNRFYLHMEHKSIWTLESNLHRESLKNLKHNCLHKRSSWDCVHPDTN